MKMYKQLVRNVTKGNPRITDFDGLYEEISHDWQRRAKHLQERRWLKLSENPRVEA